MNITFFQVDKSSQEPIPKSMVISLSGYLPGSIFSREGDIASAQNLLISFKPIICKLNYSHVIKQLQSFVSVNTSFYGP
jgi:hypothetical protein